ncbi:Fumarate reductase subunit C [invertebrate metagenome]|uniref:Fumarate reductase subunit C n=1 Tax=invertebrate metagenome TaxID=1711999 RepID=A0A484H4R8_9ZZZZ
MRHGRYKRYMMREVTSIFIGAYTIIFTLGLYRLAEGQDAFDSFMSTLRAPGAIVFHLVAMVFAIYHSTTWFNVTPQAMPLMKGEDFISSSLIISAHYAAWAAVSLVVLLTVTVGV